MPGPWSITWIRVGSGGLVGAASVRIVTTVPGGREAERIRHEVQQHLSQSTSVRCDHRRVSDAFHDDSPRVGQRLRERHRRRCDLGGVDPLERDRHRASFDPRQIEDVVDDREDVCGRIRDAVERVSPTFG